jgi:ABC-type Zn uptake system ZnuABC Zn-binding protein ZnuA
LRVIATTTFLADMARQVAGNRVAVTSLLPAGADPHAYEPTPQDVVAVSQSNVLIENGADYEVWLSRVLQNFPKDGKQIVASQGITPLDWSSTAGSTAGNATSTAQAGKVDPHMWMDPLNAVRYVENIRDGLSAVDPQGAQVYQTNAQAYIAQLQQLDQWISTQVAGLPSEKRLLVTNHENLGYYARRYGFQIVGNVLQSVSSDASPSAQQMAELVQAIRSSGAKAVFVERGANPNLADQIAQDTGVKVVTDLYVESLSDAQGPAPTYIDMLRYDTQLIMNALK